MRFSISLPVLALIGQAFAVASTDEYRDADIGQSSYLSNHNMDPNIVDSASFGLQWKVPFNNLEQFYAKPLTYTPLAGGNQLLFLASSQNWIRTLDAKTGALINARQVHTPFLQSDIGCTDIPNTIGITGTPTIDPTTDIVYFFSKTYIPNYRVAGNTGTANGVYYFHAVNINTLADVYPPVLIDGSVADNDPAKYFVGGVILQRPSVIQVGTIVYGAFGGHCDLFNYTGVIVGVDINAAKIVTQFAMESGPLAEQTNVLLTDGAGGEGGIWMSGMGIASDGDRIFVVTGNGAAHQNQGTPASGSSPLATLGQCALNLAVNAANGVLSLTDYFQPFDYQNSDGNDQDFGSGGIVLLDPTVFSGGGVEKMAVTAGKNGKVYILNVNNLGGYRLGTGQGDNVLQTIVTDESVFGAAGSYPGEGGWIYFTPVGYATYAYQLGFNAAGIPQFTQVAKTNEISAGRVGVGIPTVTSLNGEAGTAILWMTDPDAGIRAWYAVPQNGVLVNIPLPQIGGANKFQRPAFGDGMVYTTDSNGVLYCLGSPVNLPLNCTSPVEFGAVALGTKVTKTVTCTAIIPITKVVGLTIENAYFEASNASLPTGSLAVGQSFSFPVTWDLTNANSANAANASYGNISPGIKSTPLTLMTINGVADYTTSFPVGLTGTEVSNSPYLSVSPNTVDFGGIVVTNSSGVQTETASISIANRGQSAMTIIGYAYSQTANKSVFTNSTIINGTWDLGYGFTTATLPAIGSQIAANTAVSVDAVFNPVGGIGNYVSYWQVWTDGGTVNIVLEGTASSAPIANFSISTSEGGWLPPTNILMDFGDVAPGSSASLQIRICNEGGSSLEIDKSKPPNGVFRISDPTELEETLQIVPGACAYGTVLMNAPVEEYDIPNLVVNNTWTLNTNDLNFGVHVVEITATIVSKKVGPTNSTTGQPIYNYLGCFAESTAGPRLFPNEPASPSTSNENAYCQTTCYDVAQYAFAGTEYGDECWCGNIPPPLASQDLTDTMCNMACPGDPADSCGQAGWISVYYDPTKYTKGANPALYGPQTPQVVGNYILQGCYSEATTGRALSAKTPTAPAGGFTLELCEAACQGYTYWGMEYSNQCYCGNSLGAGSVNQSSLVPSVSGCSMLCTGNQNEYCGGSARLNLYMLNTSAPIAPPVTSSSSTVSSSSLRTSGTASSSISVSQSGTTSATSVSTLTSTSANPSPTGPQTVTNLAGWNYLGCWTEATNTRALNGKLLPIAAADTNVENCAAACSAYTYFGVEYSQECYCGNVINAGSVNTSTIANPNPCNMVCADNPNEYCGGRSVLNLYQVAPVVSSSSVSSSTTSPLPTLIVVSPTTSSSTVSTQFLATSSSSTRSSVSSTLSTSSSVVATIFSSISVASSISSTILLTTSRTSSSTIVAASSTTPSTSAAAPSWPGTPEVSSTVGPWEYLGCASEVAGRALTGSSYSDNTAMTIEACQAYCTSENYALAGLEYASQCYCANSIAPTSTLGNTGCSMSCTGDQAQICGGSARISLFNNTAYIYPSNPQSANSYTYVGCFAEATTGRLLDGVSYSDGAAMTVESCTAFCKANVPGSNYAGIEYASQCYCGATYSQTPVASTSCDMLCTGNNKEFCGGSLTLNVYQYQAPAKRVRDLKGRGLF